MVQICIRMFQIWFQWLVFGFECFESISNGLNLDSNASNPFRILRVPFEWLDFGFECFELAFECFECLWNS